MNVHNLTWSEITSPEFLQLLWLACESDNAIGFYRSLGFKDTPAPPDERWPERSRYDCVLTPSANTT